MDLLLGNNPPNSFLDVNVKRIGSMARKTTLV